MTNNESVAWLRYGGGQALWDEIYAQFGLKGFPCRLDQRADGGLVQP